MKTAKGAVWLDADLLPPYEYWQYWRNVDDADVGRLLRMFSELPRDEISRLEALRGEEVNEAKKALATDLTRICHGPEAAAGAAACARRTFEEGAPGADLPVVDVPRASLAVGVRVVELLHLSGLCGSGGDARRLVDAGGARVNDVPVTEVAARVTLGDVTPDGVIKLSAGRKRHALVRPV